MPSTTSSPAADPGASLADVLRPVARARQRWWARALVNGLVDGAWLAATVWAAGWALQHVAGYHGVPSLALFLSSAAVVLVALVRAAWRPPTPLALAQQLDTTCDLQDRLGTAIALSEDAEASRRPFALAALADALTVVDRAIPALAVPWRWPRRLALVPLAVALAWWMSWYRPEPPAIEGRAVAALDLRWPTVPRARLTDEAKRTFEEVRERIDQLRAQLDGADDSDSAPLELLDELERLTEALEAGELSPETALARLDDIEARLSAWQQARAAELAELKAKLAQAGAEMSKRGDVGELREALEAGELARAADVLETLVGAAQSKRDRERLAKELDKLADALKTDEERAAEREVERLQKEIDRLQKQARGDEDRLAPEELDRLEEARKELDRLQRDSEAEQEQRKHLQRLTRDVEQAADELRRQPPPQRGQKQGGQQQAGGGQGEENQGASRAADELRRQHEQDQRNQQMAKGSRSAAENLRDLIRRRGLSPSAGSRGQGQAGKAGAGKAGAGKEGADKLHSERGDIRQAIRQFRERAAQGGREGEGGKGMSLGQGGQGNGDQPGSGEGQDGQGGGAPGTHDDPNQTLGEATDLAARRQDEKVDGKKGQGPSRSEVIGRAATKGFGTRAWQDVHADYSGIVEEDMEREELPVGYRRYVERYFDLIAPAEGSGGAAPKGQK